MKIFKLCFLVATLLLSTSDLDVNILCKVYNFLYRILYYKILYKKILYNLLLHNKILYS